MKKVKLLGIMAIFGALLLTGCGKGHKLTCKVDSNGTMEEYIFYFNSDETKVEEIEVNGETVAPSTVTDEEIESLKSTAQERACTNSAYKSCKASISNRTLFINITVDAENASAVNAPTTGSMSEIKTTMENAGYSCK